MKLVCFDDDLIYCKLSGRVLQSARLIPFRTASLPFVYQHNRNIVPYRSLFLHWQSTAASISQGPWCRCHRCVPLQSAGRQQPNPSKVPEWRGTLRQMYEIVWILVLKLSLTQRICVMTVLQFALGGLKCNVGMQQIAMFWCLYIKRFESFVHHHWVVVNHSSFRVSQCGESLWKSKVWKSADCSDWHFTQTAQLRPVCFFWFSDSDRTLQTVPVSRQWGHSADRLRGLHVDEIAWNHHSIETNTNMKAGQRGRASEMLYVRVALLYTISYSSPLLHCLARFLPWSVHLQVSLFGAWWPLRLWNHVQQSFVEFCDWLGLTMPGDKKGVKYLGFGDTLAGASLKLFVFVSKM